MSRFTDPVKIKAIVKAATTDKNKSLTVPEHVLQDIAHASHSFQGFSEITRVLWARVNADGRKWRHIQKGLIVLRYLLLNGAEQLIIEAKVHGPEIKTLTDFRFVEKGVDVGQSIRDMAHEIMRYLNDDEALRDARATDKLKQEKAQY